MAGAVPQAGFWDKSKRYRELGPHHNTGLELVLVTKGQITWQIEDRTVAAGPGDVTFTFPWQEHGAREKLVPATELSFAILALDRNYARPAKRMAFHRDFGFSATASQKLIRKLLAAQQTPIVGANERLIWLIENIGRQFRSTREYHQNYLAGLARCAVIELIDLVSAEAGAVGARVSGSEAAVRRLIDSLNEQCAHSWTLEEMANACGLGRTQFAELFTRLTGDTPIVGLNRARVRMACELLLTTDRPITDIAFDVGFESSQYFSKVFKQIMGVTPRNYRSNA